MPQNNFETLSFSIISNIVWKMEAMESWVVNTTLDIRTSAVLAFNVSLNAITSYQGTL